MLSKICKRFTIYVYNNTLFICDNNKVYNIISERKKYSCLLKYQHSDNKLINNKRKNIIYLKNSSKYL